jgi:hypothetical protein
MRASAERRDRYSMSTSGPYPRHGLRLRAPAPVPATPGRAVYRLAP